MDNLVVELFLKESFGHRFCTCWSFMETASKPFSPTSYSFKDHQCYDCSQVNIHPFRLLSNCFMALLAVCLIKLKIRIYTVWQNTSTDSRRS